MASVLERNIQIELYRILQNLVANKFFVNDIEFVGVRFEPTINGRPDLVVEAVDKGKKLSLLVIETKRKVPFIDRKFDPYSKDVIRQASGYAVDLGAPYFATCNGEVLVLFDTFTAGVPLPQRRLKHYKVSFDEEFAKALLEEVCRFRIGVGKWLELDDVFLQRLRTFHTFITPFMLESLNQQLKSDLKFKEKYVTWLKSQLFEYSPKMNEMIAEQLAYMLMNRLTFYKTLETQISDLPKLKKVETEDPRDFAERLRGVFDKVCKDVDYEAIFEPHTVLDQILLPKKLIYTLNDFIEELGTYDLAKIRSDVIGRVYEELIPDVERHRLGQYYTPPPIIELITEMCIKSANDKILDPACGSGGFLVKAYHKLKDLKKKENPFADDDKLHEEILNQLYGIDINPFPAQLSSINLAVRNLKVTSRNINLVVSDFFKVKPSTGIIPSELDAVITNPPYTRKEEMDFKKMIREEALASVDGTKVSLSPLASIYAYFFIHGAKFLKERGRMSLITSNTWLGTDFGVGLKNFFLNSFRIEAIIEHDAGVFEGPVLDACITVLQKLESDAELRKKNLVKFVRIKRALDISEIVNRIVQTKADCEDDRLRIRLVEQSTLKPEEKWGKYLRAPAIYSKLIKHPKIVRLDDVAESSIGIMTGANEFFVLDKATSKMWKLEKHYLKSVVTSPKELQFCDILPEEVDQQLLVVNDDEETLKDNNANSVLAYIQEGEERQVKVRYKEGIEVKGYQNLPFFKGRKLWYSVGDRKIAPIIFPYIIRERVFFVWNKANALCLDTFHEIYPRRHEDILPVLGVLNSSLTAFFIELEGRLYGGGLLKIQTKDLKRLPVLNTNKISEKEKQRIGNAFCELCDSYRKKDPKKVKEARQRLDDAVFDALSLSKLAQTQIFEGLKQLRKSRFARKKVNVLVETAEKWKPHKKPKKEKITKLEPSKRLDTWIKPKGSYSA